MLLRWKERVVCGVRAEARHRKAHEGCIRKKPMLGRSLTVHTSERGEREERETGVQTKGESKRQKMVLIPKIELDRVTAP